MPRGGLTGSRARERRLALGLKQTEVARRVGISAAYLNLIEHNRRRIGGKLVLDLAHVLDIDPATLTGGAEAALTASLREASDAASRPPEARETAEEFAGRYPGWARVLAEAQERNARLERTVAALSDRLAHDPHLAASLHEVLSSVTAIRSTAAILAETDDIDPQWQRRFLRNLREDSRRLSDGAQALVGYLDADAPEAKGTRTPQEEMEAWLAARGWRVAALEADPKVDVEALVAEAGLQSAGAAALLRRYLARYATEAAALPEPAVLDALGQGDADPGRIAAEAGVGLATVLRRIAQVSGATGADKGADTGADTGLVAGDGSGALVFRKPVEGFGLPRFGAACPLWPLYQALLRPGMPVVELVEVAGRRPARFRACAVAEASHPGGLHAPAVVEATMLVVPVEEGAGGPSLPIGTSCRICAREDCVARREPSILGGEG